LDTSFTDATAAAAEVMDTLKAVARARRIA
jgi:hypothetical protein